MGSSELRVYWYAPFDNGSEMELADSIGRSCDLVVQSVSSRFGQAMPGDASIFELRRDLPAPAIELYPRNSVLRRTQVALTRAIRRQRLVRSRTFDVIHLHTFNMFTDWVALRMLKRHGAPIVLSVHNVRPHEPRGPRAIESLLHRSAYRVPDHLIVAHRYLKARLVAEFDVPADRISVIPLPSPDVPRTQPYPEHSPREVLFFGTLRQNKGIDVLVEAIARIPREVSAVFRFAGRGDEDLEELLRDAAARDDRIHVEIGWVTPERQAELYSRAWIVVVPYLREFVAQSGVVRVAYSFGVPVVATEEGALGAMVKEDGTGWLVPVADPDRLADQIVAAVEHDGERRERAQLSARLGAERSPKSLSPRFVDVYEGVRRDRP